MRVLDLDEEKARISIRVDSPDDLYYLSQAVCSGDLLGAQSMRRVETKDDMLRSDSQPRRRVYLVIEVQDLEFQPFTDALRVKGNIVEGPPDIRGHHTQVIEPGDNVDLTKTSGLMHAMEVIEEGVKAGARPRMVMVSVDDSECSVFRLRDYGIEEVGTVHTGSGGKRYPGEDKWDRYLALITETVAPMAVGDIPIVIVGPAFVKERVAAHLKKTLPTGPRFVVLSASSGGITGVREALSKGEALQEVLKENRVVREMEMINDLFSRIGKGSGATYGPSEVLDALASGAVDVLLISDSVFRTEEGKSLIDRGREMGSKHMVISAHHDLGKRFQRMGGIAALLRFDPGGR